MSLIKSRTARLVAGVVGVTMALSMVGPSIASAASLTSAQISAIISLLQSFGADQSTISNVQASLSGGTPSGGSTGGNGGMSTGYTFNTDMSLGSRSSDVMNLQKVLNMSSDTMVASSGAGSPGMETMTFGPATKAAVIKFQMKFGISPAAGYVGAITRAKLNAMSGGVVVVPNPVPGPNPLPQGGALSVYAGAQPSNSLAPEGASRVPFTSFTLTAGANDVTVNSVTIERAGFAQDAAFAGVVLLNSQGLQIGIAKTLNSNHQVMVGEPWVVKAGTTQTYTVAGNMAASLDNYTGQVAALNVVGLNTSASVSGSLPIMGAQQTLNGNLTIGTATVNSSSFDPNNAASQPIGTSGYRFSGVRLTAGSAEDLTFKSIRWNQSGSIGSSDIANLVTIVNGTSYPTTVSADGKYFTTVFPSGIVVTKGNSVDAYIQGDIVGSGASGRIAEFDIYKSTDVYLSGNTYGYGIIATLGSTGTIDSASTHATHFAASNTANPFFQGSTVSVTAGTVTLIAKANEVASQNIAVNVPNQILGGFSTNFAGEPVSVQGMRFLISTSSTAGTTASSPGSALTNITIVDQNGAVVAGPVDAIVGDGTAVGGVTPPASSYALIKFTDSVTFPIGRKVYTVRGKIPSTGWSNGDTINVFTSPTADWTSPTGQTTGNSVTISTTAFTLNQVTVKGAALTVSVSSQPASQTIVAGVQNVTLANYVLDATASGEDVRMSSFPVNITDTTISNLSGCQLYNGTTPLNTGSNVVNSLTTATVKNFALDNSLVVPKGTSLTISLQCNIASGATNSISVNATALTAGNFSGLVTGQTSGNSVTPTVNSSTGAVFTLASGSFAVSVDTGFASTTVAAGTSGVTIGGLKFRAANEDVNLTKVGLKMTLGSAANVGTLYLYQGSTLLGTAVLTQGSGITATSTLNTPLKLTANTDVAITIKADVAAIGVGQSGVAGAPVVINGISAEGSGLSSGNTLVVGNISTGVAGIRVFKSFPVVAADNSLASTGVADGRLMRFKVTADSHGPISLYQLNLTMATSSFSAGGGVSAVKVMVYADSAYSTAVSGTFGSASGQFGGTATPASTVGTTGMDFTATTNALQIPTGTTYYFQVEATVSSVTTGTSVTTTLNGDAAYVTSAHLSTDGLRFVATTTGVVANTDNDFIWSGNSTTTPNITSDEDWANGFNIVGLPSGGFSTTRSQ